MGKGGEEFQHSHSKHAVESALKVIAAKGQEAVNKGARVGNGGHKVGQSGGRKGTDQKGTGEGLQVRMISYSVLTC